MKRYIKSADQPTAEERLDDAMSRLKDDFDFALDGISKISIDGDTGRALELVRTLSEMINGAIEDIAEDIASE